jgi:hypothetical protein
MFGVRNWARGSVCLVFLWGCGPEALVIDSGCAGLSPGDVVITEVHANPDGSDGDGEYIELFNASGAFLALAGLTVTASRTDGSALKSHRLLAGSIGPGGFFVIGNAAQESMPAYVDYSYGQALGSLRNSDGAVSVWCGEMLVDGVLYERTVDSRALQLDGRLVPDHEANDDPSNWCATPQGIDPVDAGNFGTPGQPNSPCEIAMIENTCVEDGQARATFTPNPEDVRITEWMANPDGLDADFEWVEVSFGANADLNGFQLGSAPDALKVVVDRDECFPVDAGARVVFGASPAAAPRVDADLDISLGNSEARAIVAAVDGAILDRVVYDSTVEGIAWQVGVDGQQCLASSENEYAPDNFGTPGDPNPMCPPVLDPGMCFDGGVPREIVSPAVGEVHITEWMANPTAVDNREGEWVEIRLEAAVDLNGLTLSDLTGSTSTVESESCSRVAAGAHVVFVRNLDPSLNGGVEGGENELSLSLNNREETITLSIGGEVLDSVTYARAEPGAATQIDQFGNICTATNEYGEGNLGTPGSANPWCF